MTSDPVAQSGLCDLRWFSHDESKIGAQIEYNIMLANRMRETEQFTILADSFSQQSDFVEVLNFLII